MIPRLYKNNQKRDPQNTPKGNTFNSWLFREKNLFPDSLTSTLTVIDLLATHVTSLSVGLGS